MEWRLFLRRTKMMNIISNNICKTHEYEDEIFYKAHCSCLSDNHIKTIEVALSEFQKDFPKEVIVTFYYNVGVYPEISTFNNRFICFIYDMIYRIKEIIKISYNILFKGSYEISDSFIIEGEKAVNDYITALTNANEKMKHYNDEIVNKKLKNLSGINKS